MSFLSKIYQIVKCVDPGSKKKIVVVHLIVLLSSVLETASLILIAPIISTLAGNHLFADKIIDYLHGQYAIALDVGSLLSIFSSVYVALTISASLVGIFSISVFSKYVALVARGVSLKLLHGQLTCDYLRFRKKPNSYYINFDINEVSRFADNVLQPIAQINSRIISGVLISLLLFILNPVVAIFSAFFFGTSYFVMYKIVQGGLKDNGLVLSRESNLRTSLVKDSLRSIKEVMVYKIEKFFLERFDVSTSNFYSSYSALNVLYNVPRYVIELLVYVSFGFLIFLVSIGFISPDGTHLGYLVVFGLAAVKLLPIFQQTYSSLARIRGSFDVVDRLYGEIVLETSFSASSISENTNDGVFGKHVNLAQSLKLINIFFRYPGNSVNAIHDFSYRFPCAGRVAIVGPSGSGKSTLADILVGLLAPTSGVIEYGRLANIKCFSDARSLVKVGYVPQDPILVHGSVLSNVTLRSGGDELEIDRAMQSMAEVGLMDFVENLPNGIFSDLSPDNFGISGGQRQRIAIARALYQRAPVLVLDEPTSALDAESEKVIVEVLRKISAKILVITIAHRLNTIVDYDDVIFLKGGRLMAAGNYHDLIMDDVSFREFVSSGDSGKS